MNRLDFGQTVQVLANLGVLAGIVFLGIELQQNNDLIGAQARASRALVRLEGFQSVTDNPELLNALLKMRNGEPLTPMDRLLLEREAVRVLVTWQYVYGEFRAGLIEQADIPLDNWRYNVARSPHLQNALANPVQVGLRPDFMQWMEENVVGR